MRRMTDDQWLALKIATGAGLLGAFARVVLALHGGLRSPVLLAIEACVGATLGIIAASGALYWSPELFDAGRGMLVVGGVGGFSGVLGTRLIDMLAEAARKRLNGQ
ncbi:MULTISPECIES: hypothetical protein [Roseomonadaceae]|uniref:Holin n=1 Tax=Falsiroseomonas oleicola TaxID=2801474 RepID=A0ABS6H5P5_9PROT|nr:hypothetical protein [Roseomonas oleicola]MBU8544008.1 hypothetical protein [Roseomonas oleicola]